MLGLIGGIASGLGTLIQGGLNYRAQQETNQANIDMNAANNAQNLALTQQQWARDDTAIQRRTADLRAAGLNPVLAAGQGAQSSAPISMQAARSQAPQMSGIGDSISKGAATYSALVQARQIAEQEKERTTALKLDNSIRNSNLRLLDMDGLKKRQEIDLLSEQRWRMNHDNTYMRNKNVPSYAPYTKYEQVQALIHEWAKEHPGVVPAAILDLLGGAE